MQERYRIGYIYDCSDEYPADNADVPVQGRFVNGELVIEYHYQNQNIPVQNVRIKKYDTVTKLFSRNTGLLESDAMLEKRAVLVGCGSVGSFVAMELARSGVGKFVLCDTDVLEMHNICRHQCGFEDLGRYKVDAVKDKILNINPRAEVVTYRKIIQDIPDDELLPLLGRDTIIIGGGDNRGSADWGCMLATRTDSAFVATACWTRAFAGEVFYWESGRSLSCYKCALGDLIDNDRPESHTHYFGSDEEQGSLAFEPGIATDIDFVTIIAVKVALDLLNRDNPNYTPRVVPYLKQYTWICNTNSPKIGGERAGIFSYPLQITRSLVVNRNANCPYCGDHH
jgi:molybdopterin/thiamine biosynthesis adenylyltransferase